MLSKNRYFEHREQIAKMAKEEGFDAATACLIYGNRMGWEHASAEYSEMCTAMRIAQLDRQGSLYDLFHKHD